MKRAVVTGATGDIGSAIIEYLSDREIAVVGTHHSPLDPSFAARFPSVPFVHLDLADKASIERCAEEIHKGGVVDFLVNNAGLKRDGTLDTLIWEDVEQVIQVNLVGTIAFTRALLPTIKDTQGRIVNIASVSGEIGNNQQSNYSASKAGLIGFTKALARDVAKYGVSVNAISPGLITSRMVASIPENLQERMLSIIPQKRFGSPRSVAELVYFLLTNEENYITGQSIKVDGGLSM